MYGYKYYRVHIKGTTLLRTLPDSWPFSSTRRIVDGCRRLELFVRLLSPGSSLRRFDGATIRFRHVWEFKHMKKKKILTESATIVHIIYNSVVGVLGNDQYFFFSYHMLLCVQKLLWPHHFCLSRMTKQHSDIRYYKNENTLQLWNRIFCRNSSLRAVWYSDRAYYGLCVRINDSVF